MFLDKAKTTKAQMHEEFTVMLSAPKNSCMMVPLASFFKVLCRSTTGEILGSKDEAYNLFFKRVMTDGRLTAHYKVKRKPLGATILSTATWHRIKAVWESGVEQDMDTRSMQSLYRACGYLRPRVQAGIWEDIIYHHLPSLQASIVGFSFFQRTGDLTDTRFCGPDMPLTGDIALPAAVVSIPLFGLAAKAYMLNCDNGGGAGIGRARNKSDLHVIMSYCLTTAAVTLNACLARAYHGIVKGPSSPYRDLLFTPARNNGLVTKTELEGVREKVTALQKNMSPLKQVTPGSKEYLGYGEYLGAHSSDQKALGLFTCNTYGRRISAPLWKIEVNGSGTTNEPFHITKTEEDNMDADPNKDLIGDIPSGT